MPRASFGTTRLASGLERSRRLPIIAVTVKADGPTMPVWRRWLPAVVGGAIACLTYLLLFAIVSSAMDTPAEGTAWFSVAWLLYWFMSLPVGLVFAGHGSWTFAALLLFWCSVGVWAGVKVGTCATSWGQDDRN
jgi:hypothetical protein